MKASFLPVPKSLVQGLLTFLPPIALRLLVFLAATPLGSLARVYLYGSLTSLTRIIVYGSLSPGARVFYFIPLCQGVSIAVDGLEFHRYTELNRNLQQVKKTHV